MDQEDAVKTVGESDRSNLMINPANETKAAEAFGRQSVRFDALYSTDHIIRYKRQRVREHVLQHLAPGSTILELNSGTGEDALFFAKHGFKVHATDISAGMQAILREKTKQYQDLITAEICSFTQLEQLQHRGPYDLVFSNFGGLNCTGELEKVLYSLPALLKPGGKITLVIISRFCLWELLLVFKGKFRTAFRRFFSGNGRKAHVEGEYFKCWYYSPGWVKKALGDSFKVLKTEGLCVFVPPSYIEGFGQKYPKFFVLLQKVENRLKSTWPWRGMGDYFVITLVSPPDRSAGPVRCKN